MPATAEESAEESDERYPMTYTEQSTWWTAVLIPVAALGYITAVAPQLASTSLASVSWQLPMLISIAVAIVGVIVGTIVSTVVSTVRTRETHAESDIREKQIERHGDRVGYLIVSLGTALVLGLVMFNLEPFWIGSALYLVSAVGATWGSIAKIRAHRGSFYA